VTRIVSGPIRLALGLAVGLTLAAPSLADDNATPVGGVVPSMVTQPAAPQADWKSLFGGYTPVKANRISYARVRTQATPWRGRIGQSDEFDALLRQDFSHYGLLAVFLTTRYAFDVVAVSSTRNGSVTVQIRALPAAVRPGRPAIPWFWLIKIRKGSLAAPVKRLYITEIYETEPPPPPPADSVIIGGGPTSPANVF